MTHFPTDPERAELQAMRAERTARYCHPDDLARCARPECRQRVLTNIYAPYCGAACLRTSTTWGDR